MGKKKSGIGEVTRDDLITMVQRGQMIPADAEFVAKRLGLGPLASEPDPNNYDPMREPFWTLPMAVAWIAYRTQDAVRNWWERVSEEVLFLELSGVACRAGRPRQSGALSGAALKRDARSIADGRCDPRPGRSHERCRGDRRALARDSERNPLLRRREQVVSS